MTAADGQQGESHLEEVSTSVARGGLWSVGWQVAGLVAGVFATPFTVRLLGSAGYGVWALLLTMVTWIGLADLGMTQASTRFAGESLAQGDDQGEVTAVWTSAAITVGATAIAGGLAAYFAPPIVTHLLHVHGGLRGTSNLGLRIMAAAIVATAIDGTFNTSQVIRLRWFFSTLTTTGTAVLQVILIPIAIWLFHGGVSTAAIISAATSVLSAVGTVWIAVRLQPHLRRPHVSREVARSLLRYGGSVSVAGLATIVLTTAERLLLGHYKGATTVAIYVIASRLGSIVSAVPVAISAPLFPALVRFHGMGAHEDGKRLYTRGLQGSFLLLTPAVLLLACITHPFLSLWAGSLYGTHSTRLVYIVLGGIWFTSLAYMPQTYLYASERAWLVARVRLLELVPYIVAAAWLTSSYGALGAAIVWSARSAIDAVILFALATRTGGLPFSPLSTRSIRSLVAPCALAAAVLVISRVTGDLAARVGVSAGLMAIYSVLTWFVVLTAAERDALASLMARLRRSQRTA